MFNPLNLGVFRLLFLVGKFIFSTRGLCVFLTQEKLFYTSKILNMRIWLPILLTLRWSNRIYPRRGWVVSSYIPNIQCLARVYTFDHQYGQPHSHALLHHVLSVVSHQLVVEAYIPKGKSFDDCFNACILFLLGSLFMVLLRICSIGYIYSFYIYFLIDFQENIL